ncbi:PASTA domain-containing protein [Xanthocytophaga agilis]|uniref:PASTA domain-containing protein n=1 Tax=Xanthocytophaga agilis TaxID=3048010 RepID=A0AAE3R453_9BACT|nr:PASTA domain-containing protein [Xanthocytophaga agilis]MDJ1501070.1 PASTA domain-containing protein [Xanthocytophaga agilis]
MSLLQDIISRFSKGSSSPKPTGTRPAVSAIKPARSVSAKELAIHLGIMAVLVIILVLFFFFIYLPSSTNHNDIVEVPKITGMKLDQIADILEEHDLRYEVQDSDYVSKLPPLTVITQYPAAGSQVKEDRKIFITVVAQNPPTVEMPDLKDFSLRSAQETLENFELSLGKVIYQPDSLHPNSVLGQQINGKAVEPGIRIAKHTQVDLILGSLGDNKPFAVPNLIGRTMGEAESILMGLGLVKGTITPDTLGANATINKQVPGYVRGSTIRKGERINLWLSPPKPRPVKVAPAPVDSIPTPVDSVQ